MDYIYHYTNIETLSLILKHQTIRFNRLDRVDDISEGSSFKTLRLQEFFFVSCWTLDSEESIPQWHMYSDSMRGVRIKLPRNLFHWQPITVPDRLKRFYTGVMSSPIPFDKIFTDKYFILPMFLNENQFENVVSYTSDYKVKKNNAISFTQEGNGVKININKPGEIASLKSPDWAFQKEFRFVLMIFPSFPNSGIDDEKWQRDIPNFIVNALYNGNGSGLDFFDIDIDPHAFESMEVTLGPHCTPGNEITVKALIDKYSPRAILKKSVLTNTIRTSKR